MFKQPIVITIAGHDIYKSNDIKSFPVTFGFD